MPASALSKGIEQGWSTGETGWGSVMNANLQRINAMLMDSWSHDVDTTTGLTYGYRGGVVVNSGGSLTTVPSGTVALTATATNLVHRTAAGVVAVSTGSWPAGVIPMAVVTTDASNITGVLDVRTPATLQIGGGLSLVGDLSLSAHLRLLNAAVKAVLAGTLAVRDAGDANDLLTLGQTGNLGLLGALTVGGAITATGALSAAGGLNASQLLSGTVPSARLTGGYTGINLLGTLLNLTVSGRAYTPRSSLGNLGTSKQIDWTGSNIQAGVLNAASCTLSYANAAAGQSIVLELKQDASGSRAVVWPAGTLWEGGVPLALSTGANKTDLVLVYYNGTNFLNQMIGQDF